MTNLFTDHEAAILGNAVIALTNFVKRDEEKRGDLSDDGTDASQAMHRIARLLDRQWAIANAIKDTKL
jgi:hypothetical protein